MEDIKVVKKHLWVVETTIPSYVIAIAVDKVAENNLLKSISCKRGVILNMPFCTYKDYDSVKDSIYIECVDFHRIGVIPKSFKAYMPNVHGWSFHVPFPEVLLDKYMSHSQREIYCEWKAKYKSKSYSIKFIELADSK